MRARWTQQPAQRPALQSSWRALPTRGKQPCTGRGSDTSGCAAGARASLTRLRTSAVGNAELGQFVPVAAALQHPRRTALSPVTSKAPPERGLQWAKVPQSQYFYCSTTSSRLTRTLPDAPIAHHSRSGVHRTSVAETTVTRFANSRLPVHPPEQSSYPDCSIGHTLKSVNLAALLPSS